jgi:AraC-like DNA-binding protein
MGNGFYHVVAVYRIQYALDILKNNKSLKIEALAYDCGFNSLSSFNKYFKEIVGMKPSEYVKTH